MEYILRTENLSKNYSGQMANDKVCVNVKKGDIYGFVGENGAGKTTFIRQVLGLIKSDEGTIELFGNKKINSNDRRKIGSLIEFPAVHKELTARENLTVYKKILGIKDEKMIDQVLELVGLADQDKKLVRNYSLGMKQRLGIGLALMDNPEFLILDEPINGLDPEGIIDVRNMILKLNKEKNITFLISSHILGELSKVATCYGIIHQGKMVEELTMDSLKEQCKTEKEMEDYFIVRMGGEIDD